MSRITALCLALALTASGAAAQGTGVNFGGLQQDTSEPVEVSSDRLEVDQADGSAVFIGNVQVTQGAVQMTAGRLRVIYAAGGEKRIEELQASEGVTLVTPEEAAESKEAVYRIGSGKVTMTGEVLLTQGPNTLASDRMDLDLTTGTGTLEGGVKTILQTGSQ